MNPRSVPTALPNLSAAPEPLSLRARLAAAHELTKPRITRMVVLTAAVGFVLAAIGQSWNWADLGIRALGCLVGTALASSGANALNQWWERSRDANMPRTLSRPLPQGRISPPTALLVGVLCGLAGSLTLLLTTGPAPATIALATILIYVLCYTPLKPVTTLNTLVGAVPGALPPLIGWCTAIASSVDAGHGGFDSLISRSSLGGWSLFALMFAWQIPHVLALAWMYKEDYAKGGYRMLPIVDPSGKRTAATMMVGAAILIPASLLPMLAIPHRLGWFYGTCAVIGGLVMLWLCVKVYQSRQVADARKAFLCSVIHLPLLLAAMMINAIATAVL